VIALCLYIALQVRSKKVNLVLVYNRHAAMLAEVKSRNPYVVGGRDTYPDLVEICFGTSEGRVGGEEV